MLLITEWVLPLMELHETITAGGRIPFVISWSHGDWPPFPLADARTSARSVIGVADDGLDHARRSVTAMQV